MSSTQLLRNYNDASRSYQKALNLLPQDNLATTQKLKDQYEKQLRQIESERKKLESIKVHSTTDYIGKAPWDKAKAKLPQLRDTGNEKSSVSRTLPSAH